jgi:acetyltransferase-like isoleucine patch superfamily enzyme
MFFLKRKIIKWLEFQIDLAYDKRQERYFNRLKQLPNVLVHDSANFGIGFHLDLVGESNQLFIKENVSSKRYLNILLYPKGILIIHENVFFNNYCCINCLERIEIGANTLFGEGVKIYDHNHQYIYKPDLYVERDKFTTGPVLIGSNCWIGSNVTILKGVTIGDNVIIGANCLIYKSVQSNSIIKNNQDLIVN